MNDNFNEQLNNNENGLEQPESEKLTENGKTAENPVAVQNAENGESTNGKVNSFTLSENIAKDLTEGLHSPLFARISNVNISDKRIADVFSRFLKEVECGKTFSVIELLSAAEAVVKKKQPDESAGNHIYCYDHVGIVDKNAEAKLLANSVGGIYSLLSIHNGLYLDMDAIGGSIPASEAKRYLIVPEKKANHFLDIARHNVINLIKAGNVLADNKIHYVRKSEIIASVDKSVLWSNTNNSVTLGAEQYPAFVAGFNAVCSIVLCNCVARNNLIRFGLGGGLSNICARALGIYGALTYLKSLPLRIVYTNEDNVNVAVSRPTVADGDYLYLLKLRVDSDGLPDRTHFGQLYYYLAEKKKLWVIKDVLPIRENIEGVINSLCGENIEYVSLSNVPKDSFGVIVSVGRGESVNGLRLGYFKYIQ